MSNFWGQLHHDFDLISRRLRGMAMLSRGIVPNLVIAQRVVNKVITAAKSHLADETGETMVGLVSPGKGPETMPTLYVLDTISPDDTSIRHTHMFEQGDDLQGDIFNWLSDNWEVYRDTQRAKDRNFKWDVPLRHLGDWHKQPGHMIQPSGGDLNTALHIMNDPENDFEFLLVPIVTLGHERTTLETGAIVNYFTVPMQDGTNLRMDWWYIHPDIGFFQPIRPQIVPDNQLPALMPYPWHILNTNRLDDEVARLEANGLFVLGTTAVLWAVNNQVPLEICFMVGRQGSNKVLLICTEWQYPTSKPTARIAPFARLNPDAHMFEIFQQFWEKSEPIAEPPNFTWTPQHYLADYVAAIESHLELRSKPVKTTPIPVINEDNKDKSEDDNKKATKEEQA